MSTYHTITLACSRLTICKKTAVISCPRILKDLFSERFINHSLIRIVATILSNREALVILVAIMGPKTVIERIWFFLASSWIENNCGRTFLLAIYLG